MSTASAEAVVTSACPTGAAKLNANGELKLAFIVGIDRYLAASDLGGAVNDARRVAEFITGETEGKFPASNVCLLLNEDATYANFEEKFEKALIDRAVDRTGRMADDVLIYFAGHGSHTADQNSDEPDGRDETLLLHDSRTVLPGPDGGRVTDLRDDDFNGLISRLYARTPNLALILDSCHSGTATRSADGSKRNRFVEADKADGSQLVQRASDVRADGAFGFTEFTPGNFSGAVVLGASADRQTAMEVDGGGVFTTALLDVLQERASTRTTYNQLFDLVQARLELSYAQKPTLSGAGSRFAFSDGMAYEPRLDWKVLEVTSTGVVATGLPTPGMGEGAEFSIIPGSASEEEAVAEAESGVTVKAVRAISGNTWILDAKPGVSLAGIERGDFALMSKPSSAARGLKVRVGTDEEISGFAIQEGFRKMLDAGLDSALLPAERQLVTTDSSDFDMQVLPAGSDVYELRDANGEIRNVYFGAGRAPENTARNIAFDLANHLRQKSLLGGWVTMSGTMVPNHTLEIWLEPIELKPGQGICRADYQPRAWVSAGLNRAQDVPLCQAYRIMVKLADDAPIPLNVAGSLLSATGRMDQLPYGEQQPIRLWKTSDGKGEQQSLGIFQAGPDSLNVVEHLYVLGLPEDINIPWHLLSTAARQAPIGQGDDGEREYGTYSVLPIRTIANSGFGDRDMDPDAKLTREYTIKDFDITPYLPDVGEQSALYRVLKVADSLASPGQKFAADTDGIGYKQHTWCKGSAQANLAEGIDCSRSIWYAFSKANVRYNRYASSPLDEAVCVSPYNPEEDGYLYTGDMARRDYLMSDEFEDCLSGDEGESGFQTGDVLVYRDPVKNDGHTVMVIDPAKRIAWGSHGWDGSPRFIDPASGASPDPDLGVEYQKIKVKTDWERWDRSTMELKACWRHRDFISESGNPSYRPGLAAICEKVLKPGTAYAKSSICSKLGGVQ
tara:strand:- start:635 stop:3508 length:2874 start_codon:yes stop_codon:yes gene_type:complete